MFGEVADSTRQLTSHFTTRDDVQSVLDFPFFEAARDFASRSQPDQRAARPVRGRRLVHRRGLERLPAADVPGQPRHRPHRHASCATTTRARRSRAARARQARARADVLLARQPRRLLRRRAGLHGRRQRPGGAPGHVPEQGPRVRQPGRRRGKNDDIGSDATPTDDNFDPVHPLYREIAELAQLTKNEPGTAQRHAAASLRRPTGPASTRSRADRARSRARVRRRAQQLRRRRRPRRVPRS